MKTSEVERKILARQRIITLNQKQLAKYLTKNTKNINIITLGDFKSSDKEDEE